MIERLHIKNGMRKLFTVAALLASSAFVLTDSVMAVAVRPPVPPSAPPAPVPEVSSGWVLLPVVLAVLVFSARQIQRRREAHN